MPRVVSSSARTRATIARACQSSNKLGSTASAMSALGRMLASTQASCASRDSLTQS
jgi:hypothetical protein